VQKNVITKRFDKRYLGAYNPSLQEDFIMQPKDKTFQFRTSSYLLDLLEKLKPQFGWVFSKK